jgi:hypothetical protein
MREFGCWVAELLSGAWVVGTQLPRKLQVLCLWARDEFGGNGDARAFLLAGHGAQVLGICAGVLANVDLDERGEGLA